ncbi:hypothetical protein PR003_g18792 [Phytophthora rubi]|uniref:Uncharacterized protein n=1 Tax=Phytophthora rubi TaxID=129364 RepID=A0A6A4E4N3_9STRA|nr:hypothetical protein PR002_g19010 [Phytophthora rubi]KAE9316185.1 hypothetical protein PR003_g18792 [Phytophthora rubi]
MPGWAQRGAAAEFNLVEVANEHVLVAMGDSVVVTDLVSDRAQPVLGGGRGLTG